MPEITFGHREIANAMRDKVGEYLAKTDDRRSKTIKLRPNTPDRVIERLQIEAEDSQARIGTRYGKAELSESERESLEKSTSFNWKQHGLEAMAAKAALQGRGVDTWTDYYEPGEGVESSIEKIQTGKQMAARTGASAGIEATMQERGGELEQGRGRRGTQAKREMGRQAERARDPALAQGDPDAIEFLQEERQFSDGGIFDISFGMGEQGQVTGTGRDYERLEQRHESRSEAAQRRDEMRAAPLTRDPLEWAADPSQHDFPGIDELQPQMVHNARSERAQAIDEQEVAPIAPSKEVWAENPDEWDWPGVDSPMLGMETPGVGPGKEGEK